MQKVVYSILLIVIVLQGCSIFRKAEKRDTVVKDTAGKYSDIMKNNISNNSFYIQKANVTVSESDMTNKFLATIKFKLPDSILISVKARIGFEVARIFMTKDTLIIIDKINKKIRVGNPQVLKNKYGVEPAFIFVILGDFIIEKQSQELPLGCRNGISSDQFIVGGRTVNYTIDCKRKKIVSASFEGDIKTGNIDMEFSDFIILEDMLLPGSVNISNDLSMFKAKVEIEKATINYEGIIGSIKPGSNYIVLRLK